MEEGYPMYFKYTHKSNPDDWFIVEFTSLTSGTVIQTGPSPHQKLGRTGSDWVNHNNKSTWTKLPNFIKPTSVILLSKYKG